jgi:uncharacterized protein
MVSIFFERYGNKEIAFNLYFYTKKQKMTTASEILSFLKANRSVLKEKFHCEEIGLFGSFARNEQQDQSDVDILVQYEANTSDLYTVEQDLKNYLQVNFNRKVDVCSKKWIKPIFKKSIMNEVIYV